MTADCLDTATNLIASSLLQMPESSISPYLVKLTEQCKADNIKVGSYPQLFSGVHVSLIGDDEAKLMEIARQVEKEVDGQVQKPGEEAK